MGMMTRMLRLFKADMHGVMDQLENRHLLMQQYLREMQAALKQNEETCARLLESIKQLEQAHHLRVEARDKLEADLSLAIDRQMDDIARALMRKRLTAERQIALMEDRLDSLRREHAAMIARIDDQRNQYDHFKTKVDGMADGVWADYQTMGRFAEANTGWTAPTDEEVKLALIRYTQERKKEGAP